MVQAAVKCASLCLLWLFVPALWQGYNFVKFRCESLWVDREWAALSKTFHWQESTCPISATTLRLSPVLMNIDHFPLRETFRCMRKSENFKIAMELKEQKENAFRSTPFFFWLESAKNSSQHRKDLSRSTSELSDQKNNFLLLSFLFQFSSKFLSYFYFILFFLQCELFLVLNSFSVLIR